MENSALVGWRDEFGTGINYWWDNTTFKDIKMSDILNLFNLSNINDEELEDRILSEMWIDLDKKESIDYINNIYEKSINMYINTFLINIKKPFINDSGHHFKNKKDFIEFLRKNHISNKIDSRQIYCDLTKIMFCYNFIYKFYNFIFKFRWNSSCWFIK